MENIEPNNSDVIRVRIHPDCSCKQRKLWDVSTQVDEVKDLLPKDSTNEKVDLTNNVLNKQNTNRPLRALSPDEILPSDVMRVRWDRKCLCKRQNFCNKAIQVDKTGDMRGENMVQEIGPCPFISETESVNERSASLLGETSSASKVNEAKSEEDEVMIINPCGENISLEESVQYGETESHGAMSSVTNETFSSSKVDSAKCEDNGLMTINPCERRISSNENEQHGENVGLETVWMITSRPIYTVDRLVITRGSDGVVTNISLASEGFQRNVAIPHQGTEPVPLANELFSVVGGIFEAGIENVQLNRNLFGNNLSSGDSQPFDGIGIPVGTDCSGQPPKLVDNATRVDNVKNVQGEAEDGDSEDKSSSDEIMPSDLIRLRWDRCRCRQLRLRDVATMANILDIHDEAESFLQNNEPLSTLNQGAQVETEGQEQHSSDSVGGVSAYSVPPSDMIRVQLNANCACKHFILKDKATQVDKSEKW